MAEIVAFPQVALRTARRETKRSVADKANTACQVMVFTGVWHEPVEKSKAAKRTVKVRRKK